MVVGKSFIRNDTTIPCTTITKLDALSSKLNTERDKMRKPRITDSFALDHHGDEVIVIRNEDETITLKIKIQTGVNEFRSYLLTFENQTQVERLLPAILKGLK